MKLGLVTYNIARDWDLQTLIENCLAAKIDGIEPRTTHAHGIEPDLPPADRREVKQRFADAGETDRQDARPKTAAIAAIAEDTSLTRLPCLPRCARSGSRVSRSITSITLPGSPDAMTRRMKRVRAARVRSAAGTGGKKLIARDQARDQAYDHDRAGTCSAALCRRP